MKNKSLLPALKKGLPLVLAAFLFGCSGSSDEDMPETEAQIPTNGDVVAMMLAAMGGQAALEGVENMALYGGGTRRHLGQIPVTGGEDPVGTLSDLVETIDLENGRAAFDNVITIGDGFSQHRTEILTHYNDQLMSWSTTEGRPNQATTVNGIFSWATHNSPEMLLRRNVVSMALSALNAPPGDAAVQGQLDGVIYWMLETTRGDESVGLYIDGDTGLLAAWSSLDTETMWGDQDTTYKLSDYRAVGDLMLPFAMEIVKDDGVYASLQYDRIVVNESFILDALAMPSDVREQAAQADASDGSWVPLNWNPVTDDVTHVVAFSHNSMVVEFPEFVVVVEGPYSEGQSLTLARMVEENIGKPIRYVVPTHPHYDHTGGLRALVSLGASVLMSEGHEAELRMILESPHTNPPDALAERIAEGGEIGQIEVFAGATDISEGGQSLELYEVFDIPHVSPKVLAFVPGSGVLFQSDLFFGADSPDAQALYQAIQDQGLEVTQIVGGHGGVLPYSALEEAVGN